MKLSKIAIIDTAIDATRIGGKLFEFVNLCASSDVFNDADINHGTICAMLLDFCADSTYELVNIQIFDNAREKVAKNSSEIGKLAEALQLCWELKVDIVSLSAVSSILSDSKYLYDVTKKLSKRAVIVCSLDNMRYITVPASYPHVLGVSADVGRLLSPGGIAYKMDDPLGANVYANCDFCFLRKRRHWSSNSFAVPVVAAYVNNLLNQGYSISEAKSKLRKLPLYSFDVDGNTSSMMLSSEMETPVVFFSDESTVTCGLLMDALFEKYEVQSAALSFVDGQYDVRVKKIEVGGLLKEDLRYMEKHYKTDIIFIIGLESQLEKTGQVVEIDVTLLKKRDGKTFIKYESGQESVHTAMIPDRLHDILSE